MDRRNFIQRIGRGAILAFLAAMAGVLVLRSQVVQDQQCTSSDQCRRCNKLKGCELPGAEKFRKHEKEG